MEDDTIPPDLILSDSNIIVFFIPDAIRLPMPMPILFLFASETGQEIFT